MRGIYLLADYPDRERFLECVNAVKEAGLDFLEIGLPFSDPVADGEVIRLAMEEVLEKGFSLEDFFQNGYHSVVENAMPLKLYIMTYSNVLFKLGVEKFNSLEQTNGLIIADLPNKMHDFFYNRGLKKPLVPFITPESKENHIKFLSQSKGDFVYFVGVRGITGTKVEYSSSYLKKYADKIKNACSLPVVVGFGIRDGKTASVALQSAGGYVIGTEAVKRQGNPKELKNFLFSLP